MPSLITISSHVAYGAVGNRIIVPALEALGISVTAVSTVELPWHPGLNAAYGKSTPIVPHDAAFSGMIEALCAAPWLGQINAMMTGYLGSAAQAGAIANLVKALKTANPNALYLCDPVIGDNGGLYVPQATAIAIRDHLWPLADIVTPNLFEFGWMTGQLSTHIQDLIVTAKALNKFQAIITSTQKDASKIGNLLVAAGTSTLIGHSIVSPTPNGTGDLLAALCVGHMINGLAPVEALQRAASTVVAAITQANEAGSASLAPEHLRDLIQAEPTGTWLEAIT